MNDNFFNAALLALLLAVGASALLGKPGRRDAVEPVASMPVVMLPAVVVTGKRVPATSSVATAAPTLPVVQLPPVHVQGHRTPMMDAINLAQAQ